MLVKTTTQFYKVFSGGRYLDKTFNTFEEAFELLYSSIVDSPFPLNLDFIENSFWLELHNLKENKLVCSRGFYDCITIAKKLDILNQNGKLTFKKRSGMVRTTNLYFEKVIAKETIVS